MADDKTIQERNARLDKLKALVQQWATQQKKRLNDQVSLGKRVLKGRTGSERLAQASVESVGDLTVKQINDFLTGE
jgi:hypothetical protein